MSTSLKACGLDYEILIDKVGSKYNISNGVIVESPSGLFTVTTVFQDNSIYLNTLNKSVVLIVSKNLFIGRIYSRRSIESDNIPKANCIKLFTDYMDYVYNTDFFSKSYKELTSRQYYEIAKAGINDYLISKGFFEVSIEDRATNDVVFYSYDNETQIHLGVLVEQNKLLHHLPDKLSSIDKLDINKVIRILRYAG